MKVVCRLSEQVSLLMTSDSFSPLAQINRVPPNQCPFQKAQTLLNNNNNQCPFQKDQTLLNNTNNQCPFSKNTNFADLIYSFTNTTYIPNVPSIIMRSSRHYERHIFQFPIFELHLSVVCICLIIHRRICSKSHGAAVGGGR